MDGTMGDTMRLKLELTVPGEPIPQGSLKAFRGKGRFPIITSDNKRTKPWKTEVTQLAQAEWGPRAPILGAVSVSIRFSLSRPKSVKERSRPHPIVKPDLDKLTRAILDALTNAGIWKDDAQVVELLVFKAYGLPSARITVYEL